MTYHLVAKYIIAPHQGTFPLYTRHGVYLIPLEKGEHIRTALNRIFMGLRQSVNYLT